jgi:membrane associated rhomboid family serine protease
MSTIADQLKAQFKQGDNMTRLIIINVAVYIVFLVIGMLTFLVSGPGTGGSLPGFARTWLALPSDPMAFLTRPWTLFTYMFLHADFWHLLFNMLILFFSGRLFLEYVGDRRLLTVFLYGGIAGGMLFFIIYNISPAFTTGIPLVGASAGVVAVLVAVATYVPNTPVRLFFVLEVKLWIVAALAVVSYVAGVSGGNGGGNLAHLGGAAVGYFFITSLRKGSDWSIGLYTFFDRVKSWFEPKPNVKKVYSNPIKKGALTTSRSKNEQDRVDEILDKISKSGYEKLSKDEKEFLFKFGKK